MDLSSFLHQRQVPHIVVAAETFVAYPATTEWLDRAKSFFLQKWQDRATEMGRSAPVDVSNGCKFGSLFAQRLFGGSIKGNWYHQFVVLGDGTRIDLGEDASDRTAHSNDTSWYKHDSKFIGGREHRDSMSSCESRVSRWADEFSSRYPLDATEVTAARAPVVVPPINPEDKSEFDDWALAGLILDHNEEPLVLFHGGGGRDLDATDWYTPDIRNTREFGPVVDCVHLRMTHPASEDDLMDIYNEVFHTNFTWEELLEDEDRMFGSLADFLEENDKYYTAVRAKHDGFILSNDDTIEHQGPAYRVFDIDDVWKLGRIERK